jgi:mRNA capping enzyme/mRNA capping enzyme, catalytic domain/mRNA capping enzyme, C-terminal domain/mRNA capping enzyme, beta chain
MEVKNDLVEKIVDYYHEAVANPEVELEVLVRPRVAAVHRSAYNHIKKETFGALIQYLSSIQLKSKVQDVLGVSFQHKHVQYRFEMTGQKDIHEYCRTNSLKAVKGELIRKSWVEGKGALLISDYDAKLNMKLEQPVEGDLLKEVRDGMHKTQKYFRYKKRFSFISADGFFRYDCSVVKESPGKSSFNLASSGTLHSQEHYEVEIEMLRPPTGAWMDDMTFCRRLFSHIGEVLRVIDGTDFLVTTTTKQRVLAEYSDLVGYEAGGKENLIKFAGPMPVTLERKHLLPPELGSNSIFEDYTVTDKADGDRYLLFFDSFGKGYMIDRNLNLTSTGMSSEVCRSTLLDGEYLDSRSSKRFMCFDIYFHDKQPVYDLPLVAKGEADSRLARMQKVCKLRFVGNSALHLEHKTFYTDIFAGAKTIMSRMDSHDIGYKIDGLIYTPMSLAVGSLGEVSQKAVLGGTWHKVFKWKPVPTVDFLVETVKTDQGSDLVCEERTQEVLLYVTYNPRFSERITPFKYLTGAMSTANKQANFIPVSSKRLFAPPEEMYQNNVSRARVRLDEKRNMRAENEDIIHDGDVVEFRWDDTTQAPSWVPMLVRRDKTKANYWTTALGVWRSIQQPLTRAVMTNEAEAKNIDPSEINTDDSYYNRNYDRSMSATKNMLKFHNVWVKNTNLISLFKGKATSVFDVGCGKMGDLRKYVDAGFKVLVGVDKSSDNIENPKDGAWARFGQMNEQRYSKTNLRAVFLPMDFSKRIDNVYFEAHYKNDAETKQVAQVVWGIINQPPLEKFHNLVGQRFDLVSCQFAIHYFFESSTTLKAFLTNVSSIIKDDKYFIGTCLDAVAVNRKLSGVEENGSIRGMSQDGATLMWDIRKEYSSFDLQDYNQNWGKKISIYMETIGKRFPEYLVDFRLMEHEFAQVGLRLLTAKECKELGLGSITSTGMFGDQYETFKKSKMFVPLSKEEQEYSFLNRWFIFKKST